MALCADLAESTRSAVQKERQIDAPTMEPKLIREKIAHDHLIRMIRGGYYETMAKLAVDVERGTLALGGEWHSDAEGVLVADGSHARNVWRANFYPWEAPPERIVYTSLINLKPMVSHRKMEVGDPLVREKMHAIITRLLLNVALRSNAKTQARRRRVGVAESASRRISVTTKPYQPNHERWRSFPREAQMQHIAAELVRATSASARGQEALERSLILVDASLADPKWVDKKGLYRLRDALGALYELIASYS